MFVKENPTVTFCIIKDNIWKRILASNWDEFGGMGMLFDYQVPIWSVCFSLLEIS